jgi:hypothetical protein
VQAVFKEERVGNMLDILYFRPIPNKTRKSQVVKGKGKGRKALAYISL